MAEDPDRALLEAIAKGSEDALAEFMGRHKEKLFRFAYRYVLNEEDAAEMVAETFVRVHRHALKYRPRAKVLTWVYSITTNLCLDFHRKARRHRFLSLFSSLNDSDGEGDVRSLADTIPDQGPTADQTLLRQEQIRQVREQIDRLPPKLKTSFILHVLEEHSQKDCAALLGVSEKTVETRIYRARKHLQVALAQNGYLV